jgi:hypothetical protein
MIKKCVSAFMWSVLYSCEILMKLKFSRQFSKDKRTVPWKSVPYGRTDMTKLIVAFRNFVKESIILRTERLESHTFRIQNRNVTHLTALFGSILKLKNEGRWTQRFEQDKGTHFRNVGTLPLLSTMQPAHLVFRCSKPQLSTPDAWRRCQQLYRTVFRTCFSHLTLTVQRSRHLARDHITC